MHIIFYKVLDKPTNIVMGQTEISKSPFDISKSSWNNHIE